MSSFTWVKVLKWSLPYTLISRRRRKPRRRTLLGRSRVHNGVPPLAITNVASMKHSSSSSAPLSRSSSAKVCQNSTQSLIAVTKTVRAHGTSQEHPCSRACPHKQFSSTRLCRMRLTGHSFANPAEHCTPASPKSSKATSPRLPKTNLSCWPVTTLRPALSKTP